MTKQDLSRFRQLKAEATLIARDIDLLRISLKEKEIATTVTGSSPNLPYNSHVIVLRDVEETEETGKQKKELLEKKIKLIQNHRAQERAYKKIYSYISTVPNIFIRLILKFRYIDCCTWEAVADKIGGGNTADSVRKTHDRYLISLSK